MPHLESIRPEAPQSASVEFWMYSTTKGWHRTRSHLRPVRLKAVAGERREGEVSVWRCRGVPVLGASDPDLIESFLARRAPRCEVF